MPFQVAPLPYAADALEKAIDKQTMEIHHGKHHAAYVTNLNNALAGTEWAEKPIEDIIKNLAKLPADKKTAVQNNGGGHLNHTMFWQIMGPQGGGAPAGELAQAITSTFTSLDNFTKAFNEAGTKRFGSGWAWLVLTKDGKLEITSTANQDSPFLDGKFPIMGNDVWEHAYYLRYQNRRADYLTAWWQVVDWSKVADRYAMAKKGW
jgi:superoxide dismutase, Fe-Mn family